MKAIQTFYKGYHFRSRTEARWAVFFAALDLKFEYEKEGFDLNGQRYLPDFFLPNYRTVSYDQGKTWARESMWIEVKGEYPTDDERAKARLLAKQSEQICYIVIGQPDDDCWMLEFHPDHINPEPDEYWLFDQRSPFCNYEGNHQWNAMLTARAARFEFGQTPGL